MFYRSLNFEEILKFDKIINDDKLSCVCEDLFLFLILANFENALSAVQLATGMVRYILKAK